MKKTFGLLALVVFGFVAMGFTFYDRFNTGRHTRSAICHRINAVKKILSDEHHKELGKALTRRDRLAKFIADGRTIPGIKPSEMVQALLDASQDVLDERTIIAAVRPDRCR